MPDVGLHRTYGASAVSRIVGTEDASQCFDFGSVTSYGAGAMSFDQFDGGRRESGVFVGAIECHHLPGRTRRSQAQVAAVAAAADAFDHGVNLVAVALRVGETLEDKHGNAFGDDDAVGGGIEGAATSTRRQCMRVAETQVVAGLVVSVGGAQQDDIAGAGAQLVDAYV